ncbi:YciI family protein [Leptospira sp. 2 VSF19]|uniref:YciI family protein n=1 Tax=Leptospira soteropolitanensis TaxID=2950025 RepID=A0AAW5VSB9_9LEPT|nr:YciI family protein [Leptospira soteropolitanensis]MCW7494420.1 YciI family protein [Leptospira soteropolitanensis]MCW7502015.1 YciI family protein [Leptospira soteropolitanensis]MCW7524266.1 YciI family protein [Leptospira soteropolitanensis]MCW7528131.1 YciI family protein [Leptospira soteropolitanensis]MCW7531985.1 YciI family protein [Leptospira soteropolitanensis]
MEEYLILMRLDILTKEAQPSPEQLQIYMQQYQEWVNSIVEKKKFKSGTALSTEGRVIQSDHLITDGPYVETKESLAGFIIIIANDFDDAANIAKDCPILMGPGNSVEVRKIVGIHLED